MNVKDIRRDLHQIPELGRCEYQTKEYIINKLTNLNCEVFEVCNTGVVAFFNASKKKTICFRADMDGLSILEKTNLDFCSKHVGVSHACGHDGHMAMLLAFANWATENIKSLTANIVCLFQPSEEEKAGARDIIADGILDRLAVEEIYGFHIWPGLKEKQIFSCPSGLLASSSEVDIEIFGKGCHAANRSLGIDALLVASRLIEAYYKEALEVQGKHLVSFGKLVAGNARNSVADYAKIEATFRTFDDQTMTELINKLETLASEFEEKTNARIKINANTLYKSVINSLELFERYQELLKINLIKEPFLQAEDFGCYTRKYKAMFMLLGAGDAPMLHTDNFDFNMDILETGVAAYIKIASSSK